jgi:hypothetical protein
MKGNGLRIFQELAVENIMKPSHVDPERDQKPVPRPVYFRTSGSKHKPWDLVTMSITSI